MKKRFHPGSKKKGPLFFFKKVQGLVKYGKHGIGRIVDTWVGGLDSLIQVYDNFIEFQEDWFFQMLEVGDQKKPKNGGDCCSTSKFSGDLFTEPEAWVDWKMDSLEDVYNFGLPSLKLTFHTWKWMPKGRWIISFWGLQEASVQAGFRVVYSLYSAWGSF